jgi:hypothetical protein
MKVYNKVVIDMNTLEVIEEDSYEYEGPVALCKGGGGASGAVDFPIHMKTTHQQWLGYQSDTVESSIVDLMNASMGSSPFASVMAYDPDADLTAMASAVSTFDTLLGSLVADSPLATAITAILTGSFITTAVTDFTTALTSDVSTSLVPVFEAGMRDINQVMSSYFVIGRGLLLEESITKEAARFRAQLTAKVKGDLVLNILGLKIQAEQEVARMGVETNRIKIVAKGEEINAQMKFDEADAKWDLEVFQYGNNVLASISGAAHYVPNKEGNSTQSAIGGGLSGAATGAMIGSAVPGIGTTMGAGVGFALGVGASLL